MSKKRDRDELLLFSLLLLAGGLIGARLFFTLFWYSGSNPLLFFININKNGLSSFGALAGILATALAYSRFSSKTLSLLDKLSVGSMLGLAIGRVGCFCAGCCYGTVTEVPWAVFYKGALRHPAQLYDMANALLVFFFGLHFHSKKHKRGTVLFSVLTLYSLGRFFVEFFRVGPGVGPFTLNQLFYVSLFTICMYKLGRRPFAWLLVLAGIVLNPGFIVRHISSDGVLQTQVLIIVIFVEIVMISLGLYLAFARRPEYSSVLLSIVTFALCAVAIELAWNRDNDIYSTNMTSYRDYTCFQQPPGNVSGYIAKSLQNGTLVFNSTVSFDEYGRRINPLVGSESLVIFGGSFAFGFGLHDNETLAYYLSQKGYGAYNYAFGGHGPNNMLARLQSGDLSDQIVSKNATALYFFIDHHLRRTVESFDTAKYTMPMPRYELNGKLVRNGCLFNNRSFKYWVYHVLSGSEIATYLGLNLPQRNLHSVELTHAIILESKKAFEQGFQGDFIVIFHPLSISKIRQAERQMLKRMLRASNVTVWEFNTTGTYIAHDSHPDAEFNRRFAADIVHRLGRP